MDEIDQLGALDLVAMKKFILAIQDPRILHPKFSGGKGSNLARLVTYGFQVPPFFILSTSLYQSVLKANRIDRLVRELSADNWQQLYPAIRSRILSAAIPEKFIQAIRPKFQELLFNAPGNGVAVRSSAPIEDLADYSYAGQLETYLHIQNENQLLEAIRKCWASLWSERVHAYAAKSQRRLAAQTLAVIVQQMIPAEYAGICFTIDPADVAGDWMLIEATPGVGAELASGKVNPLRYRVHRASFALESEHQAFDLERLLELARTALAIERSFGAPQDIEWASFQQRIYILQSRPITAMSDHQSQPTKVLWSNYFFGERFPQPVSPLGWSILQPLIEANAFREPLQFLGFHKLARSRITRCFFGRPYTRLEVFRALHSLFRTAWVSADKRKLFYMQPVSLAEILRRIMKRMGPILNALVATTDWIPPIHLRNWRRFLPRYCARIARLNATDLRKRPDDELWNLLVAAELLSDSLLKLHRWSITFAELIYHFLIYLIQRWLPEWDAEPAVATLHRGLPGNKTVEMNIALWQLSRQVGQSPFAARDGKWDRILAASPEWRSFFHQFGHRSISLDIGVATLAEDLDYIFRMIQNFRCLPEEESPVIRQRHFERQRLDLREMLLRNLSAQRFGFLKKMVIEILLGWSEQFFLLRENQRHYWHHALAVKRKVVLELGRRFVQRGWMDAPNQIFFMSRQELNRAVVDRSPISLSALASRARQHQEWGSARPAAIIDESSAAIAPMGGHPKKMIGIGASPGVATGIARIFTSLQAAISIAPGEILVVPTTDPGWTPLFGTIRGLVMEVGGVLSHGAIIAREFGIPAVTSVSEATVAIPDGAKITIDGNHGVVWIHDN